MYLDQMMSVDLTARSFSIFCLSAVEQFPEYNLFQKALKEALVFNTRDKTNDQITNNQTFLEQKSLEKKSVFYSRA